MPIRAICLTPEEMQVYRSTGQLPANPRVEPLDDRGVPLNSPLDATRSFRANLRQRAESIISRLTSRDYTGFKAVCLSALEDIAALDPDLGDPIPALLAVCEEMWALGYAKGVAK